MRHGKSGRKLNRTSSHRWAMFRNMVTALLEHERIYTTIPKAKDLRRWAEWMITLGKRGDLHARRQALSIITKKDIVHKLFADLAPRFQNRPGGYTRIVKAGFRLGDAAPMCIIELLSDKDKPRAKKAKPTKPPVEKTPVAAAGEPGPAVVEAASTALETSADSTERQPAATDSEP
jgi:large subunit ribosomal protein L17